MLEVGVHDADQRSPGLVQPEHNRGAETALTEFGHPVNDPNPRIESGLAAKHGRRLVVAIVQEHQLVVDRAQGASKPRQQGVDVARLVARGEYHRELWERRLGAGARLGHWPQSSFDRGGIRCSLPNRQAPAIWSRKTALRASCKRAGSMRPSAITCPW